MITQAELMKEHQEYTLKKNLANALKRLYINPDFITVFTKHYSESYVLALVDSLAQYENNSIEYQETIKELDTISNFKRFMNTIMNDGAMAEVYLKELSVIPDEEFNHE